MKRKTKGGGDCYYIAGQFAMDNVFSPKKIDYKGTPYLVHAEVQGQGKISNLRYGHAWIEDDENVYDFSNGRELIIPKLIYYAIGNIKTDNPKKYQKYTFSEARNRMLQYKHYGCWDLDVEYKEGGEVISSVVLLAPNGNKSNLNEIQYHLVRTPEFKAWFGDWEKAYETGNYDNVSKVVDEETKEPKVMYHGSKNDFTIFNPKAEAINRRQNFEGFYFTGNKDRAESYSNVKLFEVFINIRNPLNRHLGEHLPSYKSLNYIREKYKGDFNKEYLEQKIFQLQRTGINSFIDGEDMTKILIMDDYDGVFDGSFDYGDTVAFNSTQIKLADGTNTTFDSNNPDIRYAQGGGLDNIANDYLKKKYNYLKKENATFEDLPEIYVRIGLPRKRKDNYLPSINHHTKEKEVGISVFTARYSPNSNFVFIDLEDGYGYQDYDYDLRGTYSRFQGEEIYLVEGDVVKGRKQFVKLYSGAIKDISMPYERGSDGERLLHTENFKIIGKLNKNKIVASEDYYKDYLYLNNAVTFDGKELKKYPKYTDGGKVGKSYKGGGLFGGLDVEVKVIEDDNLAEKVYDIVQDDLSVAVPRLALIENGKVIGGIYLEPAHVLDGKREPLWEYKFDIYIKRSKRKKGYSKLLLDAMIKDFVDNFPDADQIRGEVINNRLEKSLIKNYGFNCDSGNQEEITYCYLSREDAIDYLKRGKFLNGGKLDNVLSIEEVEKLLEIINTDFDEVLSIEEVEQKLGRELHWWNDDIVYLSGIEYKKVYLRPEYKRVF